MSEDPTQRYVLVVVGPVEAATIEANMEKVGGTARDVLRRQPDLPVPELTDEEKQALKEQQEQEERERQERDAFSTGGSPAASSRSSPSKSPRPFRPYAQAQERKKRRESETRIEIGGEEIIMKSEPVVYRVYEPGADELEQLYTKINYLKILEAEAQRKHREKARKKEKEDRERKVMEERKKAAAAARAIAGEEEPETDEEAEDPEEVISKRPKIRDRYRMALEANSTLQLLPKLEGEDDDLDDWDGPFKLDVEVIVKGKDWVMEDSETSTEAETTEEGLSSVEEVEAFGMRRIALLFDIAPQFGGQLTKFLVDMQRFFTQQVLDKFAILGPESSLRPEITLTPQEGIFLLTYKVNIPTDDPNCPQEEQIQGVVEDALMEILVKICGAAARNAFKRRGSIDPNDLVGGRDGAGSEGGTGGDKSSKDKKKGALLGKKKKDGDGMDGISGQPKRKVREISEEEQQVFITQLLQEMEYRMKALEAVRVMWADNNGYQPQIWGKGDTFAAKEGNQMDPMGRPMMKTKPDGIVPETRKTTQFMMPHMLKPDPTGERQKWELQQQRKLAADPNYKVQPLHPSDPLAQFTPFEQLTPRTKARIDLNNPQSFANYQKRQKFLMSGKYMEAISDHIHEKFDQGFYSREMQTMYKKVADRRMQNSKNWKPKPLFMQKKVRIRPDHEDIGEDESSKASSKFDANAALDSALGGGDAKSASGSSKQKDAESSAKTRSSRLSDVSSKLAGTHTEVNETGYSKEALQKWNILDPEVIERLSKRVITEPKHLDPKFIEKMEKDKKRRELLQKRKRRQLILEYRRSKSAPKEEKKKQVEEPEAGAAGLAKLQQKKGKKASSARGSGSDESPSKSKSADDNSSATSSSKGKKQVSIEASNKPSKQLWSEYSRLRDDIYENFVKYGKGSKPNLKDLFNDQFGTYKRLVEDQQEFPPEVMADLEAKGQPPAGSVEAKKLGLAADAGGGADSPGRVAASPGGAASP
ncbi:unnamed protein product [Amoebophrya sp. A120]|nr:unnamed protein product [Amoebophrya sp. A120]|eukprot:GSA120T00016590001.1